MVEKELEPDAQRRIAIVVMACSGVLLTLTGIVLVLLDALVSGVITIVTGVVSFALTIFLGRATNRPASSETGKVDGVRTAENSSLGWYLLYPLVWVAFLVAFIITKDDYWASFLVMYATLFIISVFIAARRGKSLSPKDLLSKML